MRLPKEAQMLAIQLPDDIEQRLDVLAKATGRSKESYLQEAIVEYLGDLEDFYLAEQRLACEASLPKAPMRQAHGTDSPTLPMGSAIRRGGAQ
jgi:predicted DNA-binding protein